MTNKKPNVLFVVCAYAFFWILLIAAVGVQSFNEELFSTILPYVQIIGTWAPTIALLVLFKKLYPGLTVKEFYKKAFKERLNVKMLSVVTFVYMAMTFGFVGFAAFEKNVSFFSLLNYSFGGFIITLFSGALGEESGWRGHLQQSTEKKYSVLKSCLIVGIIWAFWHALTWIPYIAGGMAYYIPLDMLSKVSGAFIIGICYNHSRNLLVPMWIHFVMNMVINGVQGVIVEYIIWYILLEALVAVGYIVWHDKSCKKVIAAV